MEMEIARNCDREAGHQLIDDVIAMATNIGTLNILEAPAESETIIKIETFVDENSKPSKTISSSSSYEAKPTLKLKKHPKSSNSSVIETKQSIKFRPNSSNDNASKVTLQKRPSTSSSTHKLELPHTLGSKPSYLKNRKKDIASDKEKIENIPNTNEMNAVNHKRNSSFIKKEKSKPQTPTNIKKTDHEIDSLKLPAVTLSVPGDGFNTCEIDDLKKQIKTFEVKANTQNAKISDLNRTMEKLKNELENSNKIIQQKEEELKEKSERNKNLEMRNLKLLKDQKKVSSSDDRVQQLEAQIETFKSSNEDLNNEMKTKTDQNQRLRHKLDQKKCEIDKLEIDKNKSEKLLELRSHEMKDAELLATRAKGLEEEANNLKKVLKSRETEISNLKLDSNRLLAENSSLKTQSLDMLKVEKPNEMSEFVKLTNQLSQSKLNESHLRQEIKTINSKLDEELAKNKRNENILQLRREFIKTLQETDSVQTTRLILQAREISELQTKIRKLSKFD